MANTSRIGREPFISLTPFRPDGSPVATPLWVVEDQGRLYIWTGPFCKSPAARRHLNERELLLHQAQSSTFDSAKVQGMDGSKIRKGERRLDSWM